MSQITTSDFNVQTGRAPFTRVDKVLRFIWQSDGVHGLFKYVIGYSNVLNAVHMRACDTSPCIYDKLLPATYVPCIHIVGHSLALLLLFVIHLCWL